MNEPALHSVVKDRDSDTWQRRRGGWYVDDSTGLAEAWSWDELIDTYGPVTLIHEVPEELA